MDTVATDSRERSTPVWALAIITIGIMTVFFMLTLEHYVLAIVIPNIIHEFASMQDAAWYSAGYYLTNMSILPVYGQLYHEFSVKLVYACAITIFMFGSFLCVTATASKILIIGRLICGLGGGGIYVGSIIITGLIVPKKHRSLYIALITSVDGISAFAGPMLGGAFTSSGWRNTFVVNIALSLSALVIVVLFFSDPPKPGQPEPRSMRERLNDLDWLGILLLMGTFGKGHLSTPRLILSCLYDDIKKNRSTGPSIVRRLLKVDWISFALLFGGFALFMVSFQWAGMRYSWSARILWLSIGGSLSILATYLAYQAYLGEKASIPWRILRQRTVLGSAIFMTSMSMATSCLVYYLPFYFQNVQELSGWQSGEMTLAFMMSLLFTPILSGALISWTGHYMPVLFFGASLATVGSGMLSTVHQFTQPREVLAWEFLIGFGIGMSNQIPYAAVQVSVAKEDIVSGSTMCSLLNSMGSMIGIVAAQSIYTSAALAQISKIPLIDAPTVVKVGASRPDIERFVTKAHADDVMRAYGNAVQATFFLPLVLCGVCVACCFIMEWSRHIR